MTHGVEVKVGGEVSESLKFVDGEASAEVVAEDVKKAEEIGDGKIFFENFVFDTDEDFLLRGATRKVAAGGAMTSASETEGLGAVDFVRGASFKDGFGIIIVFDVFV